MRRVISQFRNLFRRPGRRRASRRHADVERSPSLKTRPSLAKSAVSASVSVGNEADTTFNPNKTIEKFPRNCFRSKARNELIFHGAGHYTFAHDLQFAEYRQDKGLPEVGADDETLELPRKHCASRNTPICFRTAMLTPADLKRATSQDSFGVRD